MSWFKSKGVPVINASVNVINYIQEALGLGIFMISACAFAIFLEHPLSPIKQFIQYEFLRRVLMGVAMGLSALFIFSSRFTTRSGAHINPAVTITFYRMGRISLKDSIFYIFSQFAGGTAAVYFMQVVAGSLLSESPVNTVITVPGKYGVEAAFIGEITISFITMLVVLFISNHEIFKKYTRFIISLLVCTWVIIESPLSGFGMNPARTFSSAIIANVWTHYWIYLIAPVGGMLIAAQCYIYIHQLRKVNTQKVVQGVLNHK